MGVNSGLVDEEKIGTREERPADAGPGFLIPAIQLSSGLSLGLSRISPPGKLTREGKTLLKPALLHHTLREGFGLLFPQSRC